PALRAVGDLPGLGPGCGVVLVLAAVPAAGACARRAAVVVRVVEAAHFLSPTPHGVSRPVADAVPMDGLPAPCASERDSCGTPRPKNGQLRNIVANARCRLVQAG